MFLVKGNDGGFHSFTGRIYQSDSGFCQCEAKILFPLKNTWFVLRRQGFTQLWVQIHGMSPTQPKST